MNEIWDAIDPKAIRAALDDDRYVYAQPYQHELTSVLHHLSLPGVPKPAGLVPFRIFKFRTSKGYHYGKQLTTGRWVRIKAWQVR